MANDLKKAYENVKGTAKRAGELYENFKRNNPLSKAAYGKQSPKSKTTPSGQKRMRDTVKAHVRSKADKAAKSAPAKPSPKK